MTTEIKEYSKTEAHLAELRQQLDGVIFDCTTPEGYKEAKDSKMVLVRTRTALESIRQEIKAPALAKCQLIDSEARRIKEEIEALENPIAQQIQDEDDRQEKIRREAEEKARAEKEAWVRKLNAIRSRPLDFIGSAPDEVFAGLNKARAAAKVLPGQFPEELQEEASQAFAWAIKQMEQIHIDALDRADLKARAAAAPPVKESEQSEIANTEGANEPADMGSTPSPAVQSVTVRPAPVVLVKGEGVPVEEPYIQKKEPEIYGKLLDAAKAVVAHFGKFKKPHDSVVALESAINELESV